MDAIQQAVEAAKQAAAAAAATQTPAQNAVVPAAPGNMAMSAPVKPGPKLTMDTVMTGQLNVDAWLKVKEFGLLVGDKSDLFKSCVCSIDMTDGKGFVVKKGIKAGNPAQYWYTTDGVTCVQGGSWEAAIMKAKSIDQKAYEYRCVDLPFVLLEDIVLDGKVLMAAGAKLGYTTSTTNWKNWEVFYEDCLEKGFMDELVQVKVGFEPRNNGKNKWGVMTFELQGSMAEMTASE
jgi:hypothetical protein